MENHLCILYICVVMLTGYIIYIRKYLLKVVVILDTQKKFYVNKGTQTLYHEDSSTEIISDTPERTSTSYQEERNMCAAASLESGYQQKKKRYHRRKKIWQRENYYQ